MNHNRALDAAIALSRTPTRAAAMRVQELPTGVNLLLRILVGDADALSEARNLTGLCDKDLLVIVELYVLKVILYRGASARRILGVGLAADRREMRQHMGYLLAWLHPDRNPGAWRAAFASRVITAWRSVDRGEEDQLTLVRSPVTPRFRRSQRVPWIALPPDPAFSRSAHRWRRALRVALMGLMLVGLALALGIVAIRVSQAVSATSLSQSRRF
jgi:hypothetical protein